jgi:hypothetical protein
LRLFHQTAAPVAKKWAEKRRHLLPSNNAQIRAGKGREKALPRASLGHPPRRFAPCAMLAACLESMR